MKNLLDSEGLSRENIKVLYGKVMPPEKPIQNIKENSFNVLYGKVFFFYWKSLFFSIFLRFFVGGGQCFFFLLAIAGKKS